MAAILRGNYEKCNTCKTVNASSCADCDAEALYKAGYRLPSTANREEKLAQALEPDGVRTPSSDLFRELADPEFRYCFIRADRKTWGETYSLRKPLPKPSTDNEKEKLCDFIHTTLKADSEVGISNRAYISDILSEALYKAGYRLDDKPSTELVEDGFGSAAPAICSICGCRAVYVCRPGDIRCSVCYDGNPKEWYDKPSTANRETLEQALRGIVHCARTITSDKNEDLVTWYRDFLLDKLSLIEPKVLSEEPVPPYCICCEYMRKCTGDIQKADYCPDPNYRKWLAQAQLDKGVKDEE